MSRLMKIYGDIRKFCYRTKIKSLDKEKKRDQSRLNEAEEMRKRASHSLDPRDASDAVNFFPDHMMRFSDKIIWLGLEKSRLSNKLYGEPKNAD